jgi:hypothetical protein
MIISTSAGFEILTWVTMKNVIFRVIMPCSSPAGFLSGIVFNPEDRGGVFLQNISGLTKPDGIITQMTVLFIGGLEHKLLSQCSKIVEQQ